jgi:hypothetical protein
MDNIQQLKLEALDVLGKQSADFEKALDDLRDKEGAFEIEAHVDFMRNLAERLEQTALRINGCMHAANAVVPHDCANHEPSDVFRKIFNQHFL